MAEKVGVFICDCGANIAEVVDTTKLLEYAGKIPDVAVAKIHKLWCSEEGRKELADTIKEKQLTRVVIAACSPKQHEQTFRNVLESAGLNPYLLSIANIREQIAWVTKDKKLATEKALRQLASAIRRVRLQSPLEKSEIECKNDFVVVGAGIAGISASLLLARKNRRVFLVEKTPWIGGKVVSYEDVFPNLECAPCMLEPKMDEILHNENITLLSNSEVANIKGFFGNFEVQIAKKARLVDTEKCIGCGACYEACPVKVKNPFNGNLSERGAIYTAFTGRLPNAPVIDRENCLRYKGQECTKCKESCPFDAIDYDQKDETVTAEAGAIVVATGAGIYDITKLKLYAPGATEIYDSMQFERMISSTGPTEGKIVTKKGEAPGTIVFVHCAGSRDKRYKEYCSGVCCASAVKFEHFARKKLGADAKIIGILSDWCLSGKGYQEFQDKGAADGAEFIRVKNTNDLAVKERGGKLYIVHNGGAISADMLVLCPAIVPDEGAKKLAATLGIKLDQNGFFMAEHDRVAPAKTLTEGIYIAGCATGPKDIPQSVLQAQATAGNAFSRLVPGEKIELEVETSKVNEKLCGACRTCVSLCPFQAISFDEAKKTAFINEILCKGCGVCVAACPSGAITNKNFTEEQIFTEIEGLLNE